MSIHPSFLKKYFRIQTLDAVCIYFFLFFCNGYSLYKAWLRYSSHAVICTSDNTCINYSVMLLWLGYTTQRSFQATNMTSRFGTVGAYLVSAWGEGSRCRIDFSDSSNDVILRPSETVVKLM